MVSMCISSTLNSREQKQSIRDGYQWLDDVSRMVRIFRSVRIFLTRYFKNINIRYRDEQIF